ncbi:MAG TPA: PAS domain-containing protein [Burkholderiaceae bacterium]|jgi:PAS domain S-box-containing protein|nr:PAS domain-containing protein [Burkholderiaceae bacterium]
MSASGKHLSTGFSRKQASGRPGGESPKPVDQTAGAETLLRRSRECCDQMIALCPYAVYLTARGCIVHANPAGVELLGAASADELAGRPLSEFVESARSDEGQDFFHALLGSERGCAPAARLRRRNGTVAEVELQATPYPIGEVAETLVIVRSVRTSDATAGVAAQHDPAALMDALPALIGYIDHEERYVLVNAAHEAWFNRPREEIVGRTLREVLGPFYGDMQPHVMRVLQGEKVSYEARIRHAHSGNRSIAVFHAPDKDADGQVRGFSSMAVDITEYQRQRFGRMFPEQERRAHPAPDATPTIIAQCDKDYRLQYVDQSYLEPLGFGATQAVGKRIPDLIGESAFGTFRQYIDAALSGKIQEYEVRLPSQEAGDRYAHIMYAPECDEKGEVHGMIATFSDTTRLRRAEDQLYRRELEFKTLVENSPDVISRIDRAMRHLYVNPAIESAFGMKPAAYLGKTKAELGFPGDVVDIWNQAAQKAFEAGAEQTFQYALVTGGKTRHFSTRVIPEPDRSGAIESLLCMTYDVTERTKIERERDESLARERSARIQAETAARARDEFLAIVSHEMRAPLNGIQSWAHVLENYMRDATSVPLAQRALQGIKTGIGQQVRLIEDLLDVTRMMSGKLRLVRQPVALLPAIQAAVESVRGMAAAKRISITCTYKITKEQIEGDSDRVQQIVWNLLSNAIKFTPDGGNVWLTASHTEREACVAIRDDGIGISPDFLPHLFDRFSQEDTSSTRGHSGLGLGLFLVQRLVELHGGRVEAESEGENRGTTVTVHLPLRTQREKYALATLPDDEVGTRMTLPSLRGLHILLIDDQEEARESLTIVLTTAGATVFAAASAHEALAWLPTLSMGEMPDVLLCDIAMPGEDGYAVLRKIRTWKTSNGFAALHRIPALALTAFSQREDRIRALTAGFQMHIPKPVAPEELIVVIATMVSRG